MAGIGQINVVKVESDFYPSGSSAHETPTGVYSIGNTPNWASGQGFNPYSYTRQDTNPTGGVYSSTNWAISLSGSNSFYWHFSGDAANSSELYLIGENTELKQDIYLPSEWTTTGDSKSTKVFIDDNTYNSGIFKSGISDLSYKITGINVVFNPRSPALENMGYTDFRSFDVTIKKNFNENDFIYYIGNSDIKTLDVLGPNYYTIGQGNPIQISIEDTEVAMQGLDPNFTFNTSKKLYITKNKNGSPVGSFSDHYHISTNSHSGNLTGSLNPDNFEVQIKKYQRNTSSGIFGHLTGVYKIKEYLGHSEHDGPSKVYQNASGSLIQAQRSLANYDVSSWEILSKHNDGGCKPKYISVAESSSMSKTLPASGKWNIKYPSIPSATPINQGLFHIDGINFICNEE
jgi:hypothetical protein